MPKSEMVRARITPELKYQAEQVFRRLGLTATQAITLFYRQVELHRGLPFDVVIPKAATRKTLQDTDAGHNLVVCENLDDMFARLGL